MLRPNKHSDPDLTILPLAGQMLLRLRSERSATLTSLRDAVCGDRADKRALFVPALYTLFLLGTLEYRGKTDSVEYTGR